jgi:hypothetical protein
MSQPRSFDVVVRIHPNVPDELDFGERDLYFREGNEPRRPLSSAG